VGLEEALRSLKSLTTDTDYTAVWEGVAFYQNSGLFGELMVEFKVVADIAQLFLNLTDGLKIGSTVKSIASAEEKADELAGNITTSNVEAAGKVVEDYALIYRDDVRHTVTGIDDDTRT